MALPGVYTYSGDMLSVTSERRQRRSDSPMQATRYFLEHLARRLGCEALAVSTEDGFLVDGIGEGFDLDLLGALAALPSVNDHHVSARSEASLGRPVQVHGLDIKGHSLFVTSVGGSPLPVNDCAAALGRIHGLC